MCGESLDGWRNIFWLQCGLHVLTAIGFFLTYWPRQVTRSTDRSIKAIFWRFDLIGTALYMVSVSILLLALNWAGGTYPWKSPHVLAPLILGVVLLFTFAIYGWYFQIPAINPIITKNRMEGPWWRACRARSVWERKKFPHLDLGYDRGRVSSPRQLRRNIAQC